VVTQNISFINHSTPDLATGSYSTVYVCTDCMYVAITYYTLEVQHSSVGKTM